MSPPDDRFEAERLTPPPMVTTGDAGWVAAWCAACLRRRPGTGRSCTVRAVSTTGAPDGQPGQVAPGRLSRDAALSLLQRGADLLAAGEFADAAAHYARVVGFDDPAITGAALLGLGEARYRLNDEAGALATWSAILQLPENPSTYAAWRNVAAARVRDGDNLGAHRRLPGGRQAGARRGQGGDREPARLAVQGDGRHPGVGNATSRRARGDGPLVTATLVVIAVTTIVSLTAMFSTGRGGDLSTPPARQAGRGGRRVLAPVDGDPRSTPTSLHLAFNMYALYLMGTIVERWYGSIRFLVFYLACAAAGSTASFVFGGDIPAVGASGAVFGMLGVLLAAGRLHHPVDRQSRGHRQPAAWC